MACARCVQHPMWLAMTDSDTNTKRCKTGADVASTQSANRLDVCSFKLFCGGETDKKYVMLHPQFRLVAHAVKPWSGGVVA